MGRRAACRRPVPVPRLLHRQRRRQRPGRSGVAAHDRGDPGERSRRSPTVDSIRYLVCHHADPDIAASLPYLSDSADARDDVEVVTEWRAAALLEALRAPVPLLPRRGARLGAAAVGRAATWSSSSRRTCTSRARWCPTTPATATLFSSDLFGGFVPDNDILVSDDVDYIVANATPFHQHYMPSRRPPRRRSEPHPAAVAAHRAHRAAARSRHPGRSWSRRPSRP